MNLTLIKISLIILFLSIAIPCEGTWISWQNPSFNASQTEVVDSETGETSISNDCSVLGTPLTDLAFVHIYRWPGILIATKDVHDREGLRDSSDLEPGWNYWFTTEDDSGHVACTTPTYYVPGSPTGIPIVEWDQIKESKLFDVRGRLIMEVKNHELNVNKLNLPSGIYFLRSVRRTGREMVTKITIIK